LEVKGWLVDGVTQLWARVIEEGLRGGDGSSSEVRRGHAGVSANVERRGMANEGECRHWEEGPSDAWRERAGGGGGALHGGGRGKRTAAVAGAEQGNRRVQRKEMRGENGQGLICKIKKI
jgi:hypothetical protein